MSDFYYGSLTKDARFLELVLLFGNNLPQKCQESCSEKLINFAGKISCKLTTKTLGSEEYEKVVRDSKKNLQRHGGDKPFVDRGTQEYYSSWVRCAEETFLALERLVQQENLGDDAAGRNPESGEPHCDEPGGASRIGEEVLKQREMHIDELIERLEEHLKERRFIERDVSHVQSVWYNEGYADLDKIDLKIEKVICDLKKWGGWMIEEEDEKTKCPKDLFKDYKLNSPFVLEMLRAEVSEKGILDIGEVLQVFVLAVRSGKVNIRMCDLIEKAKIATLHIAQAFKKERISRERQSLSDNVFSWTGKTLEDVQDPADQDMSLEGKLFCNWLKAGRRYDEMCARFDEKVENEAGGNLSDDVDE